MAFDMTIDVESTRSFATRLELETAMATTLTMEGVAALASSAPYIFMRRLTNDIASETERSDETQSFRTVIICQANSSRLEVPLA